MEYLEIESTPFKVIKKAIGILNIVAGILMFSVYINEKNVLPLIASVFIACGGVYLITNGFGLERSWLRTGENFIIIKWINMIRPVRIHETSISKIILERARVVIYNKLRKPLKLDLSHFERAQKTEIYNFLIEYSKQKKIILERD